MRSLSLLFVLCVAGACLADEVHLKAGGTVVGTVIDEGDPVVVKTPTGGTIKIARDKIESIEIKPLPAGTSPDAPPRERKPRPSVKFQDVLTGWAIRPPVGWRDIKTAKGSKASFALVEGQGPHVMDVKLVKTDMSLGQFTEAIGKQFRTSFKDYESRFEKGATLGTLGAKELAGTYTGDKGEKLAHVSSIAISEKGLVFMVLFTVPAEEYDALLPEIEKSFASFELLPKLTVSDADMKRFFDACALGLQASQEGNDAEAISQFEICAGIVPTHADSHRNLAVLAVKTGNQKRAIEEYTTLAKLRPDDPQAAMDLGTVLFKANRFPDALAAFRKALDLWPDFVDAWINIGAVHSQIAEYEQAIKAFKTALEIDPKCAPAWFNLGNVEHARNHYDEARKAFEAVLKIQPDHSGAKDGLKKLKQEGH